MKKREIRIKANYSFWKHPIRWWKERRQREVMEALVNWNWENGGKEELLEKMTEFMIKSQTTIGDKTFRYENRYAIPKEK